MEYLNYTLNHSAELLDQIKEHLWITSISILLACMVGITAGILITKSKKIAPLFLGFVSVIQTIPSLALLGFLLPLFGIGLVPAIIALFLYALLPIVRNTFTGIMEIAPSVKESAVGMGLTPWQVLSKVELPLALPTIFAGIRTSTVITVGIATLCALIGAGGLGEMIFRGISLNNSQMILAGAIPASILALVLDGVLAMAQKMISKKIYKLPLAIVIIILASSIFLQYSGKTEPQKIIAGFNSEFIEREDGFVGLNKLYNLPLDIKEMEIGLMYSALKNKKVDVIDGFSTDGRIKAFDLRLLKDDKNYFPPYFAAPLIKNTTLEKYPELKLILKKLAGSISQEVMSEMNYKVDKLKQEPEVVAQEFLASIGIRSNIKEKSDQYDITIGSKAFTENFILSHIIGQLIEAESNLRVDLKLGFGGTKIVFEALKNGDIDIYPEYTGTGLLVLSEIEKEQLQKIIGDKNQVYQFVEQYFQQNYQITWGEQFGFNNTFALMMRNTHADSLNIITVSDLSYFLNHQ